MKKAVILFLAVLVLFVGTVSVLGASVHSACDQVVYTEQPVYGDPREARGLTVSYRTTYDYKLLWDTVYPVGGEAKTEFTFSANEVYPTRERDVFGISLNEATGDIIFDGHEIVPYGLGKAASELSLDLMPGEEATVQVKLEDYFDCYPLAISVELEDYQHFTSSADMYLQLRDNGVLYAESEALAPLTEYFRIPILEGDLYEVSVGRDVNGYIGHVGGGTAGGDNYFPYTYNAVTADACYFTIDTHSTQGTVVDTSLLPDGYGIFRVPLVPGHVNAEGNTDGPVVASELEMVYPLDPTDEVLYLQTDGTETRMLLWIVEDGMLFCHIIDLATMEQLQKLEIAPWQEGSGMFREEADFTLVVMWHSDSIAVVAKQPDGSYALEFVCRAWPEQMEYLDLSQTVLAFDGRKLAVCTTLQNLEWVAGNAADLFLAVYDGTGMTYCGHYISSLHTGVDQVHWDYHVDNFGEPIRLQWES